MKEKCSIEAFNWDLKYNKTEVYILILILFSFFQEIKLLMRIQKKLLDMKSSDVTKTLNFDDIKTREEVSDAINGNVTMDHNFNETLNS